MRIACYTSVTASYLPVARIVAKSVKAIHPEWDFYLLFNDKTPEFIRWEDEPFDHVIFAEWLDIKHEWRQWAYNYSVIEFCTATKGAMGNYLFDQLGYDALVYMDPDTVLFSRLEEVLDVFENEKADVILTPHLTNREYTADAIWSHEMAALKHGTFNLGFYAIANRPNGRKYLDWWADRLVDYAHIDFDRGLFTDQKWCNLAPYLFEGIEVFTYRTYNIATWNMTNRNVSRADDGTWLVNGDPLRFYHFSGFGHDFAWADRELATFGSQMDDLRQLWSFYRQQYELHTLPEEVSWKWGHSNCGEPITDRMRNAARELAPLNPYDEIY